MGFCIDRHDSTANSFRSFNQFELNKKLHAKVQLCKERTTYNHRQKTTTTYLNTYIQYIERVNALV